MTLQVINAQQESFVIWSFETKGKILSHPIIDSDHIYFGSDDKTLYAVDINSGKQVWAYKTNLRIRSKPLIFEDILYFNSGNDIYALNKRTGKEEWSQKTKSDTSGTPKDYWDYHSGEPVIYKDKIYFGLSSGELNAYQLKTGKLTEQFITVDSASIKCGLVIDNSILYFGDWSGKVYALNLKTWKNLWTYETYKEQPYETFGQINSKLLIYDDLLIFGARNPRLQILNKNTGKVKWDYIEKEGGWISGDPVVKDDILFIGGSDNHAMLAFNVHTGEKYWSYIFLNNNFSKPLPYKDFLLFTTGDAYSVFGESSGHGYLYAVNRNDGKIINVDLIGGNAYTSPVEKSDHLYLGSVDGKLYAVDLTKFLSPATSLDDKGYNSIDILQVSPTQFIDTLLIEYNVNYETALTIKVTDLSENEIKDIFSGKKSKGSHSTTWNGLDNKGNYLSEGYYFIEIRSLEYYKRTIVQKINKADN
jgi:outer membrane protein assembly factor BamB